MALFEQPTLLQLTVVSGPDAGLSRTFRKGRISIGREGTNDFVLTDGFVSNRHGEFRVERGTIVYRDLKSRHGSLVMLNNVSTQLNDSSRETQATIGHGAELQVGCTIIRLIAPDRKAAAPAVQEHSSRQAGLTVNTEAVGGVQTSGGAQREQFITAAHEPVEALTRRFDSNDRRLEVLFRLAGQLNALTTLDEILERIMEATFDAFPAANFFAVSLVDDPERLGEEPPLMMRARGSVVPEDDQEPILSTSLLKRVIESRESVLFVKDSLGANISQSIIDAKITSCLCAPLVGQRSLLGVMQVDTRGRGSLFSKQDLDLFSVLASNVAFAMERAKLADDIVEMFESFVDASVTAIEARDPTTAGHSQRVATYTVELARVVNDIGAGELKDWFLSPDELTELRYAALLHDFGKIAVREDVLQKASRLPELHMDLIEQRFETIKALTYQNLLAAWADQAMAGKVELSPQRLQQLEGRYRQVCEELDATLDFLFEATRANFLQDEDIERVRRIGQRHYVDSEGRRQPIITAYEVENLTIRRGTLNDQEWEDMRSHAARSEDYLQRIPWSDELKKIPCIAGAHHEKLDGTGYPLGLKAEAILPQVRMLTIADIFDALTAADRPYRKAATVDRALEILNLEANDGKLDLRLVELFAREVVPRLRDEIPSLRSRDQHLV